MNMNFRKYWADINRLFLLYSIVPLVFLMGIGYPMIYHSFLSSLWQQNEAANSAIADTLDRAVMEQTEAIETLRMSETILDVLAGNRDVPSAEVYREIYGAKNTCGLAADFFVLGAQGEIVFATVKQAPECLQGSSFIEGGPGKRMREQSQEILLGWDRTGSDSGGSMCLGGVVKKEEEPAGYVVAYTRNGALDQFLSGYHFGLHAVTNSFGRVYVHSIPDEFITAGKLDSSLRSASPGRVEYGNECWYLSAAETAGGRLTVYTMTDVSYLDIMFVRIGMLFLISAALIVCLLAWASRRFAKRKSKMLDDMVSAIRQVRQGDLTKLLDADTGDEFQLFAEEYNRMLVELEKLMAVNEEIGRETAVSELKQLESQFNPHFLFNTLAAVRYMIAIDQQAAQEM